MAEEKKEEAKKDESPEDKAASKLTEMRTEIEGLQLEVKILEGMIKNRKPEVVGSLKADNAKLEKTKSELEQILFAAIVHSLTSNTTAEHQAKYENLRKSSLNYFKKAGIDSAIWKNLES